jgi:transcriptional regulator with XRE-family HTH domain
VPGWNPHRFLLLAASLGLPNAEVTRRAGLSRQLASKLVHESVAPTVRTFNLLSKEWGVSRQWLEDGTGPCGLPLPPGLRACLEDDPPTARLAAAIYAIKVADGGLLKEGATWTRRQWSEQLDKFEFAGNVSPR